MRGDMCARLSLLWTICLCVPLGEAAPFERADARHPTEQQLIGAWRLVSIDLSGPNGPIVDSFYQADSSGLIIYDSSGWMSVQITAPHRQAWPVPASRSSPDASVQHALLKAAAFDTYYAYHGTWTYDQAKSVVTHHVDASLIPAEIGLNYAQTVTMDTGHLIFTGRDDENGEVIVRRKVWERIPAGHRSAKPTLPQPVDR
jgi:hypothetical protein